MLSVKLLGLFISAYIREVIVNSHEVIFRTLLKLVRVIYLVKIPNDSRGKYKE